MFGLDWLCGALSEWWSLISAMAWVGALIILFILLEPWERDAE